MKIYNIKSFYMIAIILSIALLFGAINCRTRSRGPSIVINTPEEDPYITKDGSVDISGTVRSRRIKQVEFLLKDDNGTEIIPCDPVIPNNDRTFETSFQIDNPGKYILTTRVVGQESGVDKNIIYSSAPKFFINNMPQPDGYTLQIRKNDLKKIKVEVRDEDGDLDKVIVGKTESPITDNKLWRLSSLSSGMGNRVPIIAMDKQENLAKLILIISDIDLEPIPDKIPTVTESKTATSRSEQEKEQPSAPHDKVPPVFVYNGIDQQNGATIILKIDEKPEIKVKDNVLIAEVDGVAVKSDSYTLNISTLKEGFKTIIAKDTSGNLARLNIVKDITPPNYEAKSPILKRIENKLFIKDGDNLKLEFKDNYRLSKVVLNDEEIRNINEINVSSERLKNENKINVYDMSNNILTLNVVKYSKPILTIESPKNNSLTNSNQLSVTGTVSNGYGRKQIFINGSSSPISDEKFSVSLKLDNEGENKAEIYIKDEVGQSNIVNLNITRDTIPPKVEPSDNVMSVGNSIIIIEKLGKKSQEVQMSDRSGISRVLVNNRNLRIDGSKIDIPYNILSDGKENVIKIQDLAGNEAEISLRFNKNVDVIFEQAIRFYEEKKYNESLRLLDDYDKRRPGLPTTNLYRGMIYYEKKDYQTAINYLEEAYARRSNYDERGPNIEYNLFYWGASLYNMLLSRIDDKTISKEEREKVSSSLLNKAIAKIDQFLNYTQAEKRTPNLYKSAVNMKNELAKISKEISITSQK